MRNLKSFILLTLIGLFIAGCATSRAVKEADQFAAQGAWDEAVLLYGNLLKEDPDDVYYKLKYRRATEKAARVHDVLGGEALESGNLDIALFEFEMATRLDPTLKTADESLRITRARVDSFFFYDKGLAAATLGKEREARHAFNKALSLYPDNASAQLELKKLTVSKGVVIDGVSLDIKSTKPITLEFKSAKIKRIFSVFSKLSGINFVFDSDVKDKLASIQMKDATFREILDLMLMTNKLSKKVVSENTILIYPSTTKKKQQYEDMVVKVFYLTNIDAKKAVNLIRTMVKVKDIYVHEELNALVIREKPENIELVERLLKATDLADAEVVLAVEILEVTRNEGSTIGVDFPDSASATVTFPAPDAIGSASGILFKNIKKLSSGDMLVALPTALTTAINFSAKHGNAKILANPRVRVKNKEKASIHIGDKVPIITATVSSTGVSTENVQYQDVGIKLNVEPIIRPNDEIDLSIKLEVSSLGTPTTTKAGSVVYQIGTRNADTVLRLYDGETQIIGGLISDEERTTTVKFPGLGDIPIIGRLFASVGKDNVKTEILLSITPHIVRRLEVPSEEVTTIWMNAQSSLASSASGRSGGFVPAAGLLSEEEQILFDRGAERDFPPPPPPPMPGGFLPENFGDNLGAVPPPQ